MASGSRSRPRILTIAGSDSSGGAGIQADLKTFQALECYGLSVITAITAQNSKGVLKEDGGGVLITPPEFIEKQMRQCWKDGRLDAVKIGMLGDETAVKEVAEGLQQWRIERKGESLS